MTAKQIAVKIRRDFEVGHIDQARLIKLYRKYHRVQNMKHFIGQGLKIFPRLSCGLASVYLRDRLRKGKIIRGKFKDYNHTFLVLDRNTVIDITADQYGGPRVHFGKLAYPWKR
jgi:hypothetical protein